MTDRCVAEKEGHVVETNASGTEVCSIGDRSRRRGRRPLMTVGLYVKQNYLRTRERLKKYRENNIILLRI